MAQLRLVRPMRHLLVIAMSVLLDACVPYHSHDAPHVVDRVVSRATGEPIADAPTASTARPRRALYSPKPKYLREWAEKGIVGKGILELTVNSKTGQVTSARMLKSTGYKVLDNSAIEAFSGWHFRPGTVSHVRVPIEFTNKRRNAPTT